jgi:hypothetical protein
MAVSPWWPVALKTPIIAPRDLKAALTEGTTALSRGDYEAAHKIYTGKCVVCDCP